MWPDKVMSIYPRTAHIYHFSDITLILTLRRYLHRKTYIYTYTHFGSYNGNKGITNIGDRSETKADSEASEATREKPTQSEWSESQMIRTTPWSEALT